MIYSYSSIIRTQAKDMGITLEALLRVPSVIASTTMRSTYFPNALDFKCGPRSHFFFPLRGKYHAYQSLSELMYQMDCTFSVVIRTYPYLLPGTPAATATS